MKPARKALPASATVQIERIGAEGDGIAHLADDAPIYVPLTLPGEAVLARPVRARGEGWLAEAEAVETTSRERAAPPCGHFGRCGGCALQHWADEPYRHWKASLVATALRHAGYTPPDPVPFRHGLPGERRRMDFAVRRFGRKIVLGLHGAGSSDVEDLTGCLVLHPTLQTLLAPLRTLFAGLSALRKEASVIVNLLDAGPDLLLRTDAALTLEDRTALTQFATANGLPRVAWAGKTGEPETIALLRPPVTALSGIAVRPPPGAFLQATEAGEHAIIAAMLAGLPRKLTGRARIAELYAGCGTLGFALAPHARVTAWEGDAAAVAALRQAVNQGGLSGRIEPVHRDMARQPVSAKELSAFAAVVLDPPYAGAAAQIGQIAASGIGTVIYVSCNPAVLGRDARGLRSAGYHLDAVTAIDQFLWSARVESVAVFRR
ncbi:MAG TPA: RsmD family RNA methyltransferase [Rhodopila sp.]|nr:RsmD family RNA methyltransferase [Rhodopila sp.]